jgi:molecular chaperone GrpE
MLLRALRTPRPQAHRTYNRYTGGVDRRSTLNHPPSRYGRGYCSAASDDPKPDTVDEEQKIDDTKEVPVLEDEAVTKGKIMSSLEGKIAEAKANWHLALAETDNVTKKMFKEISRTQDQASDRLAQNLFPVSDTIDFCLRHRPDFESEELKDNLEAKGAFDGLEAAKRQFVQAMKTVHITEIVPQVGDQFDPMLHNACFEVEKTPNSPATPGQIGVIVKTGWSKNNTLLRAADVGVVKVQEIPLPFTLEEPDLDDDLDDDLDSDSDSDEP